MFNLYLFIPSTDSIKKKRFIRRNPRKKILKSVGSTFHLVYAEIRYYLTGTIEIIFQQSHIMMIGIIHHNEPKVVLFSVLQEVILN